MKKRSMNKKALPKREKKNLVVDGSLATGETVVEITVKKVYIFDKNLGGYTPEQLVQAFFRDFDINQSHASRDYYHVGNADVVTDVKILKSGDRLAIEEKQAEEKAIQKHDRIKPSDYEFCPYCSGSFSFKRLGKNFICQWCHKDVRKSDRRA